MSAGLIQGTNPDSGEPIRVGVLTSGGDAPGMNAAVRAITRTAIAAGAQVYAIQEGWVGAIRGGDYLRPLDWSDVAGILGRGGTVIGSARSDEFRSYQGRQAAARNLVLEGINHMVVIGGDGSLTGSDLFRQEWPQHLAELVESGQITPADAARYPELTLVGLVGSIDNDMIGTDMTIGADTALDRIVTAMDQIASTAASHQRTFIVEVMGRECGYLPLMAAVAAGADYVFTPEHPARPGWQRDLCERLALGRSAGRRETIVLVAEGARDTAGQPITTEDIADALREGTGEEPRISILGHIQRGGSPSAYDRWLATILGYAAAQEVLDPGRQGQASLLGIRQNRITRLNLQRAVAETLAVQKMLKEGHYQEARRARGKTFYEMGELHRILSDPPQTHTCSRTATRVAILNAGGLAPGMNTAARAAVRIGLHRGWNMLGVEGSWDGLAEGKVRELSWAGVEGWGFSGGAELGTRRAIPPVETFYALSRAVEQNRIDALLIVGGFNAYVAVKEMLGERSRFPSLNIPMVVVPASIDNNVPGTELTVGADTALGNAVWALDRIKQSAAATRRCFVAETMGRTCGYLALMSGLASGAEFVYLNEERLTLDQLNLCAQEARGSFEEGRRLLLAVMGEETSEYYDRQFVARIFEAAGEGLYDVRSSALGHIQQGGAPTPFDRLLATRLVNVAMERLSECLERGTPDALFVGMSTSNIDSRPIASLETQVEWGKRRPLEQWWLSLKPIVEVVSLENTSQRAHRLPIVSAVEE